MLKKEGKKKNERSGQESQWKSFHREDEREKGGMDEGKKEKEKPSHTTTMQQIGSVQWTCVLCLGRQ